MKSICKRACKTIGILHFTVGKLSCTQRKERNRETVYSKKADQAYIKCMKWPPPIFHEKNYTIVVTGNKPNGKYIMIFSFFFV